MQREKADLIIWGGTALTIDSEDAIIENAAIAIKAGRIKDMGTSERIKKQYSARKYLDLQGKIMMPGIINTHTHVAMSLFRGVADDVVLDKWLNDYIFPLEEKYINKDSAFWGSMLSCAEMVLAGTTTFCDMYFFEKETGRAAEKIGMRAVIGEGIVAMGNEAEKSWQKKKILTEELLTKFKKSKLVSIAIEPHSPYTCDADVLKKSKDLAMNHGLLYIIHLSETKKEFSNFVTKYKMTPVEYLESLGVLDENTLAAHCVWMGKSDFRILKAHNVKISHCPESNMKLGSGIAPLAKFKKNGITVGLGTDGAASNNTLDMFREMKSAALLAKVNGLDSSAICARDVLRMATIDGAKALHKEHKLGSLEIGKCADIITIDVDKPHMVPIYDYYSHLVYCAGGGDISDVIVDGKIIMRNRKIACIDIEKVMKKVNLIAYKIMISKF